jgi:hypothetical protein
VSLVKLSDELKPTNPTHIKKKKAPSWTKMSRTGDTYLVVVMISSLDTPDSHKEPTDSLNLIIVAKKNIPGVTIGFGFAFNTGLNKDVHETVIDDTLFASCQTL